MVIPWFNSSTYQLDGHLGCFHFSPIMEMLKRTFMYKFLCRHVFISLGYIMSRKIAESYGNSMLNFLRNCQSFPQSNCIVLNSQQQRMRVPSYILTNTCYCLSFSIAIPVGKVISTAFLICLSLMTNDAEHFSFVYWSFVNFLAEKCLLRSFAHFLVGSFAFYYLCKSCFK